ncbi:metallophosphoesterase family protein [Deinococcus roseus]|uniref:DNA methylase n=1 Tax=Deinococcus roseus TaxID=392414 RepID=A0ABQ2CW73_9DEIO|nr:metallophosphoesterase family protein [Deinococcus roseus]GGJ23142.1 DNA methylase [Deinococcus roseus]
MDLQEPVRIAAISDIHSNLLALQAVWEDLQKHSPDLVVCLGDHLWGSLQPRLVADFLMEHGVLCISGNQDRSIHSPTEQEKASADFAFLHSELSEHHLQWLLEMPATLNLPGVLLCHGTPTSDTTYLLETVTEHGVRLASEAEILQRLDHETAPLVLCGHSHVARVVQAGNQLIVNPGSVGIPAYDDDVPYPHVMESGSPHARYALLSRTGSGWSVSLQNVVYDWEVTAQTAALRGRSDRACWIRTGRVEPFNFTQNHLQ